MSSKKRLLVIEDDADVADMLTTFFTGQGYEVIHKDSGDEGIQAARKKFPNLILLDLMLPDVTGFDVCRSLRTMNLTRYIPIIFLTQRDGRADKIESFELGADDYITKPFDIEELRLRVQNSIKRATRDNLHETRTGLPTGSLVESMYNETLLEDGWTHLQIKIKHFDNFRDKYGFMAADDALDLTGQIMVWAVNENGFPNDFVGTDAEASFVIFTKQEDTDTLLKALQETFKENVSSLYSFEDLDSGMEMMTLESKPYTIDE